MKKLKVNIDRPRPSSDEILSRRNFDEVLKQYNATPGNVIQKPFWKSGWFLGSLATAAVVTLAVVIYVNKTDATSKQNSNPQPVVNTNSVAPNTNANNANGVVAPQKRSIAPPLKGLDVAFSNYSVNAAKGGVITHSSGSKLTFPANAFVDAGGNAVSGDVQISYREFHDAVDFFLSGIPMQYDSAGTTYEFESAGMMEISATQNGRTVYLNKNTPVKVEMVDDAGQGNFNIYHFNAAAGNWEYMGKDAQAPLDKIAGTNADTKNKLTKTDGKKITQQQMKDSVAAITKQADAAVAQYDAAHVAPDEPVKPIKVNKANNRFTVDYSPAEFPELSSFKDVVWEVDEAGQTFDRHKFYSTTWEDMRISHGASNGKYILTLTKGLDVEKLNVYPVLDGKNFDDAMKVYEQKYKTYLIAADQRKKDEAAVRAQFGQRYLNVGVPQTYIDNGNISTYDFSGNVVDKITAAANNAKVSGLINTFTIIGFGIFNCDCPQKCPQGASAIVVLKDDAGSVMTAFTSLYHADRARKGLFSLGGNPTTITYDPQSSNLIWGVANGDLYYADEDQFKTLPSYGNGAMNMTRAPQTFKTADEMKAYFHIGRKYQQ